MINTPNNHKIEALWLKISDLKVNIPSFSLAVDWIIDNQKEERKKLTFKQLKILIDKLVEFMQKFNNISDIEEIKTIIKEIELNFSSYYKKYLPVWVYTDDDICRYFNRAILKWKDRIIMISLEKIENILKTSTNNDLTKEQRKELEELMINCEQITEIDNPQKIDIYIKKLEELNSMINDICIDDSWIRTLLYKSRWTILSLDLKQEKKEN